MTIKNHTLRFWRLHFLYICRQAEPWNIPQKLRRLRQKFGECRAYRQEHYVHRLEGQNCALLTDHYHHVPEVFLVEWDLFKEGHPLPYGWSWGICPRIGPAICKDYIR